MNRILGFKRRKKQKTNLNDTENMIGKREGSIEKKIADLDRKLLMIKKKMKGCRSASTKANLTRQARQILLKKKTYEKHLNTISNQSMNVSNININLESAKMNVEIYKGMKQTTKQLKKTYKKMDIDQVEDVMDEMEDVMEDSEEIGNVLGRQFGVPVDVDDDELMDELDMLEDEDIGVEDSALDALDEKLPSKEEGNEEKNLEAELMGI